MVGVEMMMTCDGGERGGRGGRASEGQVRDVRRLR